MFQLNLSKLDKKITFIGIAVLVIIITGILILLGLGSGLKPNPQISTMSTDEIVNKSMDFLNGTILQAQGRSASLEGFTEESGLIKITIKIDSNTYNSYVTKDGKLFFPEGINLDQKLPELPGALPEPTGAKDNQ